MGEQADLQVQWVNVDLSQRLLEHIHDNVVEHFLTVLSEQDEKDPKTFQALGMHAKQQLDEYVYDDGFQGVWNVIVGPKYVGAVSYGEEGYCYFEIFDARQTKQWPQGRTVLFCTLWLSDDPVVVKKQLIQDQVEITTPRGYKPGDMLPVKLPDGRVAEFKIPKGATAGKKFFVNPADALAGAWD